MAAPNFADKTLWTGDNLDILRGMNSESVDLIYLDPPFNSNKDYAAPVGSAAAGAAFKDTWSLSDVDVAWMGLIADEQPAIANLLHTASLTHGKGMQSYLTMMAVRLLEMRRVLKDTGKQDRVPFTDIDVVHLCAVNVHELRFERKGRRNLVGAIRDSFCFHDIVSNSCGRSAHPMRRFGEKQSEGWLGSNARGACRPALKRCARARVELGRAYGLEDAVARVPYLNRADLPPDQQHLHDSITAPRGGRLARVFSAFLNAPELAARIGEVGAYIRCQSVLPDYAREITILTTATELGCQYEFTHHVPIALQAGVRDLVIEAIRGRTTRGMLPKERVYVDYARQVLTNRVNDPTFSAIVHLIGIQGAVETTMLVGYYAMLAHTMLALNVELESELRT